MSKYDPNGIIRGGDTPFLEASEAWRHFGADHRPLRIELDGKDGTRLIALGMCAMMWNGVHGIDDDLGVCVKMIGDQPPAVFMREFIAGANTDLRAVGVGPLIGIAEVEKLAPHVVGMGRR